MVGSRARGTRLAVGNSMRDGLSSVAVAEMREAFAHARAELAELRASVAAGEGMADYAARSPLAAEWIRDLGRMAQRLRGSGLMALVSGEDAGLARDLAAAMVPRDPLVATVPEMWRVSRDDLLGWPQAERELPRLVRVVERFMGYSYGEATEALRRLDPGDAPMILTDEQWHVVSPADAWTLLSDHITRDDVEMLGEVAHDVLTESDPFYGMSGSERMWAQYEGVDATYSRQLRHGVATTLALLGSGPPQPRGASAPFANAAGGIVSRILRVANNDPSPKAWAAVARELPLLAGGGRGQRSRPLGDPRRARWRPPALRPSGAGRRAVRDRRVESRRGLQVHRLAGASPDGGPSPRVRRHRLGVARE